MPPLANTHLDQAGPAASVGSRCPIPEADMEQEDHWRKKISNHHLSVSHVQILLLWKEEATVLTVVRVGPDCMVQDCMDPWEHQGVRVVLEDHVDLVLHVGQEGHVGHPWEWQVPDQRNGVVSIRGVNKKYRSLHMEANCKNG